MGLFRRAGERRDRVHPADRTGRSARPRGVPPPPVTRERVPPVLLAQARAEALLVSVPDRPAVATVDKRQHELESRLAILPIYTTILYLRSH